MVSHLLLENEQRRRDIPLWQLLCFVMFCVWQMGVIYFIGPALNIDGRTPLPISPDNLTVLIVAGYVCSILVMVVLPRSVIWMARLSTAVALVAAVGLFFPWDTVVLTVLIYIQCFCCCFMIGFESATMVHYFSADSVTRHLLIAYPIGYTLIALIQSDFIALEFSTFRILVVVMLCLLGLFYFKMPAGGGIRFVKKADGLVAPKRFLCGFFLLAFLGALLGVIAPAAAAEAKHGVFAAYIGCAAGSALLYLLHKKTGRHPICFVSIVIGVAAVGYLLWVVSAYVPALQLPAAVLSGLGMSVCALLPGFALLAVKQYPSKLIVPGYIALAMLAVVVQAVLVELFRTSPVLLNLCYLAIVMVFGVLFFLFEPFLLYAVRRKFSEDAAPSAVKETEAMPSAADSTPTEQTELASELLTNREQEIVRLISCGHSNGDIAKMLFISEHTVKDHTKSIYRKCGVHSRFELMAMVNRAKPE